MYITLVLCISIGMLLYAPPLGAVTTKRISTALCSNTFVKLKPSKPALVLAQSEDSRADHVVKHVEAEILGCCSKSRGWNRQSCIFFPFLISLGKTCSDTSKLWSHNLPRVSGPSFSSWRLSARKHLRCTWPLFSLKFRSYVTHKRPIFQQEKRPRTALCSNTFVKLKPSKPALVWRWGIRTRNVCL